MSTTGILSGAVVINPTGEAGDCPYCREWKGLFYPSIGPYHFRGVRFCFNCFDAERQAITDYLAPPMETAEQSGAAAGDEELEPSELPF